MAFDHNTCARQRLKAKGSRGCVLKFSVIHAKGPRKIESPIVGTTQSGDSGIVARKVRPVEGDLTNNSCFIVMACFLTFNSN